MSDSTSNKTHKIKPQEIHIVPPHVVSSRIQEYGVGIFDLVPSKSSLKKALKKGWITINDHVASSATFINGNETIKLYKPVLKEVKKKLNLTLEVLFEDDYLAIIHKPPGILVSGNSFKTIANGLVQNLNKSNLPDAVSPQPVHRIDFATTGLLMIGKTSLAIRALNKMFEQKKIYKTYIAITIGQLKDQGDIKTPIDEKEAHSIYKKIASVPSERFKTLNLVQVHPLTGKRHQIRKHLQGINNPILGDQKYGKTTQILYGKGMYLHAYSLEFKHPMTQEQLLIKDNNIDRFIKIFPNYITS